MQHIITDEEAERAWNVYAGSKSFTGFEAMRKALTDFLNRRPESTIGKLRPIAEMPETVPEGCVRLFGSSLREWSDSWGFHEGREGHETHFIDLLIPTPDPEAEMRREFEEAMTKAFPLTSFAWSVENDSYKELDTESAWQGWKLAKKGGDK